MEQLKESDVEDDEISDVDREMINRLNATEGGKLVGRITDVKLREGTYSSKDEILVCAKTPVGNKSESFTIPDTPTDEDRIVRLCKDNGVDPKYPSMLEGCKVKWDGDELVIPRSRGQKARKMFDEYFVGDDRFWRTKMAFFYMFLPITLTTYYLTIKRVDRDVLRSNRGDFAIHMLVWFTVAFPIIAGLVNMLV